MMDGIKWIKQGREKFPYYIADIGPFHLRCVPEEEIPYKKKRRIVGWCSSVYFGGKWSNWAKIRKFPELSQKDAEILLIEFLTSHGFSILKVLKRLDLLEEVLSEVGIDLE